MKYWVLFFGIWVGLPTSSSFAQDDVQSVANMVPSVLELRFEIANINRQQSSPWDSLRQKLLLCRKMVEEQGGIIQAMSDFACLPLHNTEDHLHWPAHFECSAKIFFLDWPQPIKPPSKSKVCVGQALPGQEKLSHLQSPPPSN